LPSFGLLGLRVRVSVFGRLPLAAVFLFFFSGLRPLPFWGVGACPFVSVFFLFIVVAFPSSVSSLFAYFPAFGFSGSRSFAPSWLPSLVAALPSGAPCFVGCASGLDASVRALVPGAVVFSAASFRASSFSGRLALRSAACVRACASASGLWCSFPSSACPSGLVPCSSPFSGSGSGSWASLALAVWLRVPCLLWLPSGVAFPPAWGSRCGCVLLGASPCGGSFFLLSPLPAPLSLF
jgi:hypothetical protein